MTSIVEWHNMFLTAKSSLDDAEDIIQRQLKDKSSIQDDLAICRSNLLSVLNKNDVLNAAIIEGQSREERYRKALLVIKNLSYPDSLSEREAKQALEYPHDNSALVSYGIEILGQETSKFVNYSGNKDVEDYFKLRIDEIREQLWKV